MQLLIAFALVAAAAVAQDAPTGSPASDKSVERPIERKGVVQYQPGVTIDFNKRQVQVAATVIRHEPPVELFACAPRIREHEALIRIDARPRHVYEAMGLIGLTPGAPLRWDEKTEKVIPATGDPVRVRVRYERNGKVTTVDAWDWLKPADGKPLTERPVWVFAGSLQDTEGRFAADLEGTVVAVVDFPDALISLAAMHSSSNDELWLEPAASKMPPIGTSCTMLLEPTVGGNAMLLTMDRFGELSFAGAIDAAALEAAVRRHVADDKSAKVVLSVSPLAAEADVARCSAKLRSWGVAESSLTVKRGNTSSLRPNDPEAVRLLLAKRMAITEEIRASLAEQSDLARDQFSRARSVVSAVVVAGTDAIDTSVTRVQTLLSDDRTPAARAVRPASVPVTEPAP